MVPPEAALEGGISYVQISSISECARLCFCTMPHSLFCLSEASPCCMAPLIYPIVMKSVTVNSYLIKSTAIVRTYRQVHAVELGIYDVVTAELNDIDRFKHHYAHPAMKKSQAFFDSCLISMVCIAFMNIDHWN